MKERVLRCGCLLLGVLLLAGCSSRQLYEAGQGWRQNECGKLPDQRDYERCVRSGTGYEEYQKQRGEAGQ